jgi:putative hydrolase of the HAD superfamily
MGAESVQPSGRARRGVGDQAQWNCVLFNLTWARWRTRLAVRAVIFDYGMVLTHPQDPAAHAELVKISGLPAERLDALYWADRDAFDRGAMTGEEFWRKIGVDAGLKLTESAVEQLTYWDARMWMKINPAMLTWQQALKQRGLQTAIVSNMGDAVLREMQREFDWLAGFDVLVWSYQLKVAKPDAVIYRHVLEKLGIKPGEALFIDDRQPNIDAAIAAGMKAICFTTVEKLRTDLRAAGLDKELPMP